MSALIQPFENKLVPTNAPQMRGFVGLQKIENSLPWWVIHTRPRCEKKMDVWLAEHGMGNYLPVRTRLRIYPGKKVAFDHPLFAGYAFGAFTLQQRNAVYGSGYAAGVIEVVDQEGFLRELDAVRQALSAAIPVTECPYLAEGRRVRIVSGKLRGMEGIVQRRARRTKLILSVELLQRSLALEIEPELLEPIG